MKTLRFAGTLTLLFALVGGLVISPVPQLPKAEALSVIAQPVASFETSLSSRITADATEMTLTTFTTDDGTSLTTGKIYGFTLDEGGSNLEYVIGTASTSNRIVSMTRGLSVMTASTTVTTNKSAHGRGAPVKITDAPALIQVVNILNALDTLGVPLRYGSEVATTTFTLPSQLINKEYADYLAFNGAGVVDASQTARGVVELATGAEAAASTATGASGALAIPSSIATSTGGTANTVPVTGGSGTIDDNFIPSTLAQAMTLSSTLSAGTTTINGSLTLSGGSATSNIASSSIQAFTASTSPSTTWTKPANLKYVKVYVIGKGGNGGAGNNSGTTDTPGAGGSSGGVGIEIIPASALGATETVVVSGTIGISSSFGSHCSATSGANGQDGASGGAAFAGGVGTGCEINIGGGPGVGYGGSVNLNGGAGGSNMFGGGGEGDGNAGGNAVGYGSGGGGGGPDSAGGGTGANGAVFVEQFFF